MGLLKMLFGSINSTNNSVNNNAAIDLTFGDIILLWVFEKGRTLSEDYSGYFQYKYCIDPKVRTKVLIDYGYLEKAETKIVLGTYKVSDLKELCLKLNLQATGKKSDLITRLETSDNIHEYMVNNIYALSALGKTTLEQNIDVVKYHKYSYNLEPSEFSKLLQKYGTYDDAIINYLNDNDKKFRNSKDWGLLRCNKMEKARFSHYKEDYESEMLYYIETFYFDLSGYDNSDMRDKLKDLMIAPGVTCYFSKNKQYYNESLIEKAIYECAPPKHYFTNTAFKNIIEKMLTDGDSISLDEILKMR